MRRSFFYIPILFLISTLFGCLTKSKEKKDGFKEGINNVDKSYVNVLMENDTLSRNLEKGVIRYFYKINDSIKLSSKDKRTVYAIFALKAHDENGSDIEPGHKVEKELTITPINTSDTISIPINITPHFLGKGVLVGVLVDTYTLNTSDKEKLRVLTFDSTFEKEVYITENSNENPARRSQLISAVRMSPDFAQKRIEN